MAGDARGAGVKFWVVYIALIGGNYMAYHLALPVRVSYHVLITALLIRWLWRDGLPSTPLVWPLALTALTTLVSAFGSGDTRMALENWWHWLINGLLLLMLISWTRQNRGETLFKGHFAVAGAIIAVSTVQWLLDPATRVGGAFLLINLTGAYAAALLLPALVWAISEKRLWLFGIAGGLVAVLAFNGSRGAYLSAGVAVAAFLVLTRAIRVPRTALIALLFIPLAAGFFTQSSVEGHVAGDSIRQDLWRSALAMFRDNPLTGVGPGLFGQSYRQYRAGAEDNMTGAHSLYLNLLAETGLVGAAASGLTGVMFLRSIARRRSLKQNAVLAALVGVAVHLAFDNYPATNFVFLVNLYAAYLVGSTGKREQSDLNLAVSRNIIPFLAAWMVCLLFLDAAQFYYEESLKTGNLAEARAAATLDNNNRLYQIQVARLEGNDRAALALDSTLSSTTDLLVYGIINFGRVLY